MPQKHNHSGAVPSAYQRSVRSLFVVTIIVLTHLSFLGKDKCREHVSDRPANRLAKASPKHK
jgi:hypothetical protein